MVRRVAVLVVWSLVGTLGVLLGTEAVVPPPPASALPPVGVSTLAGTGTRGQLDGAGSTARFDIIRDTAIDAAGEVLYTLEIGTTTRPNAVRKVDIATGVVSTFATGSLLQNDPQAIEVDQSGNVWVSIDTTSSSVKGIVRISPGGTETMMLTDMCCSWQAGSTLGDAFYLDEDAGYLYYSSATAQDEPDDDRFAELRRIAIGSLPAVADAGTSLGVAGSFTRGPVYDIEPAPNGDIYVMWGGVGLVRVSGSTVSQVSMPGVETAKNDSIAFAPGSSSLYHVEHDVGAQFSAIVRRSAYGAGDPVLLAGGTRGSAIDGDPGRLWGPDGLTMSPDGRVLYFADEGNYRIRQLLVPPDPNQVQDGELCAPCNAGQRRLHPIKGADPVDLATGTLTESFTDLTVPARGVPLAVTRTYNSYYHDRAGIFGPGWSSPLDMSLRVTSGFVAIAQENGALLPFSKMVDGTYEGPPRVTSTLERLDGPDANTLPDDGSWVLTRNHRDTVTFDPTGQVVEIEDRNGYSTFVTRSGGTITLQSSATPTSTLPTPGGRTLTLTLSGGLVQSVSDDSSPARTVTYGYTSGRLTSVTTFKVNAGDATAATWGYGYDPSGRLSSITDPRGNANLTVYDVDGRVDHQLDHAGQRTDLDYGLDGLEPWTRLTAPAHDAGGTRSTTEYRFTDKVVSEITTGWGTPSARTTEYDHDPDTLGVTEVRGPGGGVQASYTFDDDGNVLTAGDAAGRTTTYGYTDPLNPISPTSITDPDGNTTTFEYDADGNLVESSAEVAPVGGATEGTAVTTFERSDPAHPEDVTAIIGPDQQGAPTPKKTVFSHRAGDGQLAWMQDPEGYLVNAGQKPSYRTTYGYDTRGFVTSVVTPRGNATSSPTDDHETTFVVNDFGMVQSVTNPLGETKSTTYDGNGNVTAVTDANAQTTTTDHDAMNRPTVVQRPDASESETTYFPNGAVQAQVNGLGDATTFAYDVHGAVVSSTDAQGRTTGFRYDDLARLVERVEPGGTCPSSACTTYGYDSANQLTSVSYSDPATPDITDVGYDALGQRASLTRSAGPVQTWAWDNQGRLRSSVDGNGRTTAYGWTLGGDLDTILYPGQANPVDYAYDAARRMTSVTDWAGRVTSFGWTRDSQWRSTDFPSGNNVDTRTWDEAGRLASVEWRKGAVVLGSLAYDRDPEGAVESETPAGGTFSTRTWGYDDLDRLDTVGPASLGLDDAGNLTRTADGSLQVFDPAQQLCWTSPTATTGSCSTPAADATAFTYDDRGNRTATAAPGPEPTTGYTYDQENRLTGVDEVGAAPLTDVAGVPVPGDYDGDGADDVLWYQAGTGTDWASWGDARTEFGRRATSYAVDGTYRPIGGDFDGDGHGDVFWYAPGATADPIWFWFGDGTGEYLERSFAIGIDRTPLVGDFDGDGFDDVFFYGAASSSDVIWFGDADVDTTSSFTVVNSSMGGTTYVPATGDFDGDGHSDILWYRPGTDSDLVWFGTSTRGTWTNEPTPINGTYTPVTGDLDGDGKDDLLLYSPSGVDTIWWGDSPAAFGVTATSSVAVGDGYTPVTGDFDGDGKDDLLLHDPTGATDDIWWGASRTDLGTSGHTGLAGNTEAVADYAYDGVGLRSAKTVGGTTTQYTWDIASDVPLLLSEHQGGDTTYIVYGPGGTPLYQVTAGGILYYHQDHQDSTRLTTNSTGNVVAHYAYDAYGELTTNTHPTGATPALGYAGQHTDAETGFVYLRARYMDPTTGQFLSRDPMADLTRSPYAYADADPINRSDPTGLCGFLGDGPCTPGGVWEDVKEGAENMVDSCTPGTSWSENGEMFDCVGGIASTVAFTANATELACTPFAASTAGAACIAYANNVGVVAGSIATVASVGGAVCHGYADEQDEKDASLNSLALSLFGTVFGSFPGPWGAAAGVAFFGGDLALQQAAKERQEEEDGGP